ncbi:hypothetical protein Phum_PHUM003720 [Pediculus humanus corporis]|uniref:DNA polymerase alpha subunit B N-terminal domain-containing protein n=1 Tax=Pediculus humanus subsp. corporis TaxID=121224 RepID=E0V944_PEDHC|nr:uncharacterized protein Phum_PHUM003720 [Pediculus humanus corporis]EEB09900.1 hypothetical protein Phum_PHUM003720 [Pediculus humanus corporis]
MSEFERNIVQFFDELGVSCSDKTLQKCLELCKRHNVVDAEEFVDTWMAYSVSYLGGEGPNETNLIKFERENYIKKPAACTKSSETISTKSLPAVYGGSSMKERDETARIIMAYNETTPKTKFFWKIWKMGNYVFFGLVKF